MTEIVEKHKPYLKILVNLYFSFIFFVSLIIVFNIRTLKIQPKEPKLKWSH